MEYNRFTEEFSLELTADTNGMNPCAHVPCMRPDGLCVYADKVHVPGSVVEMATCLRYTFVHWDDCPIIDEFYNNNLDKFACHAHSRVAEGCSGNPSAERFPVLRGAKKARRLDNSIGAMAADAVSSNGFRSTARMAAAGNVSIAQSCAGTMDSEIMADYTYETGQLSVESKRVQVSLTASNIRG